MRTKLLKCLILHKSLHFSFFFPYIIISGFESAFFSHCHLHRTHRNIVYEVEKSFGAWGECGPIVDNHGKPTNLDTVTNGQTINHICHLCSTDKICGLIFAPHKSA